MEAQREKEALERAALAEKERLALEQKMEEERLEKIIAQNAELATRLEKEALEHAELAERAERAEKERLALEQKIEAERLDKIKAQKAEIAALLENAERDSKAGRLSSPAGNNAYDKYRKVQGFLLPLRLPLMNRSLKSTLPTLTLPNLKLPKAKTWMYLILPGKLMKTRL